MQMLKHEWVNLKWVKIFILLFLWILWMLHAADVPEIIFDFIISAVLIRQALLTMTDNHFHMQHQHCSGNKKRAKKIIQINFKEATAAAACCKIFNCSYELIPSQKLSRFKIKFLNNSSAFLFAFSFSFFFWWGDALNLYDVNLSTFRS